MGNNQAIPGYEVVRKLGSPLWQGSTLPAKQGPSGGNQNSAVRAANTDYINRFQKEGKAAAKLNHPNTLPRWMQARWETVTTSSWSTWTEQMSMSS